MYDEFLIIGDTFPLGCAFDGSNIHHKVTNVTSKCI